MERAELFRRRRRRGRRRLGLEHGLGLAAAARRRAGLPDVPVVPDVCGPDRVREAAQGRGPASAWRHGRGARSRASFRAAVCAGGGRFERWFVGLGYSGQLAVLLRSLEVDCRTRGERRGLDTRAMAELRLRRGSPGSRGSASRASRRRTRALRARVSRPPGAWGASLGAVPRYRRAR